MFPDVAVLHNEGEMKKTVLDAAGSSMGDEKMNMIRSATVGGKRTMNFSLFSCPFLGSCLNGVDACLRNPTPLPEEAHLPLMPKNTHFVLRLQLVGNFERELCKMGMTSYKGMFHTGAKPPVLTVGEGVSQADKNIRDNEIKEWDSTLIPDTVVVKIHSITLLMVKQQRSPAKKTKDAEKYYYERFYVQKRDLIEKTQSVTLLTQLPQSAQSVICLFVPSHMIFAAANDARRVRERSKILFLPNLQSLEFRLNQTTILAPQGIKFTPTRWNSITLRQYFSYMKSLGLIGCDTFEEFAPHNTTLAAFNSFYICPIGNFSRTTKQNFAVVANFDPAGLSPRGFFNCLVYSVQHELKKSQGVWSSVEVK